MLNTVSEVLLHKLTATLVIDYLNQKLGAFEPFVEPWNFELHSKSTKKAAIENSKLKLISIDQQPDKLGSDTYRNGLNINITTELMHTFKELEMKYLQREYD